MQTFNLASVIETYSPFQLPANEANKQNCADYAERAVDEAQRDQAALITNYSKSYRSLWFKQLGGVEFCCFSSVAAGISEPSPDASDVSVSSSLSAGVRQRRFSTCYRRKPSSKTSGRNLSVNVW